MWTGREEHRYRPDFIALVDDGHGADDPLHLVLEVKGQKKGADDAKHDTMRRLWVPSVNALGRFGRWSFIEWRSHTEWQRRFAMKRLTGRSRPCDDPTSKP